MRVWAVAAALLLPVYSPYIAHFTIMRAPGHTQGMFALESAMDEMAVACGLDPVDFRIRNEPVRDPESGLPFSLRCSSRG